ncbi:hypothetical protein USDA257_p03870 (plasmid) [Sinorhizobium fredii USDA 257]|uniref:Uncharacterized protein n=1 Tax=Sinorhizobium fredii (strain USDA 257) TaxID=1185652 RepID=I3XGU6_SINF2|nr:hypothetical protein USDA257_p03870 [Sinorhizobium fredii USDA 257]
MLKLNDAVRLLAEGYSRSRRRNRSSGRLRGDPSPLMKEFTMTTGKAAILRRPWELKSKDRTRRTACHVRGFDQRA